MLGVPTDTSTARRFENAPQVDGQSGLRCAVAPYSAQFTNRWVMRPILEPVVHHLGSEDFERKPIAPDLEGEFERR